MCDIPQIRRSIRGVRKSIRLTNKQISRLEKRKAKELERWQKGLSRVEERIQKVSDAINRPKQRDLASIENFINGKKAAVEAEFAPKLARLSLECSDRQQRFDTAMAPLLLKLQINIELRNKLQQDYDNDPTVQKINTRAKLMAQDKVVQDLQSQINSNQQIHNERLRGCSPSDKGSLWDLKAQALAYWDKIKENAINNVNAKYGSPSSSPLLFSLNQARQFIVDRIAYINSGYDSKINQHRGEIAFYEAQLSNLNTTLTACLNGNNNDCGPVSIPICLPGYELVESDGPCPEYTCEPVA